MFMPKIQKDFLFIKRCKYLLKENVEKKNDLTKLFFQLIIPEVINCFF